MKAAVVEALGAVPVYREFPEPVADIGETVVEVRAAPLSPIVRRLASGTHYAGVGEAGFVPGVDGVGVDRTGRRVYFLFPKAPFGSMAELTLVQEAMTVPVPEDVSDARAAAVATGGLASWIALTRRAKLEPGAAVLINGVTGAAGGMAVQVARHLGAGRVIGVGRDRGRLDRLELDEGIVLDDDSDDALRSQFGRGIDIVLDFVWAEPAMRIMRAATAKRGSRAGEPRLRYVQLGTMAGEEIALRGDALRSSGLELLGSGIGSVAVAELVAGATELLGATRRANFEAPATVLPLASIAEAWSGPIEIRHILSPSGDAR